MSNEERFGLPGAQSVQLPHSRQQSDAQQFLLLHLLEERHSSRRTFRRQYLQYRGLEPHPALNPAVSRQG